jgi:hypothetical protein
MEEIGTIRDMLPFLIPVLLIELALLVIAILDLVKREYVTGGNKIVWIVIIVLVSMFGPIIYLIFGRKEKPVDGDQN